MPIYSKPVWHPSNDLATPAPSIEEVETKDVPIDTEPEQVKTVPTITEIPESVEEFKVTDESEVTE